MEAYVCVALHSVQNTLVFGSSLALALELRDLSPFFKREKLNLRRE